MSEPLPDLLRRALDRRRDLLPRLHAEGTDCYRLLHGVAEGAPGLTIDRYGTLLLAQTFREALPAAAVAALREVVQHALGLDLPLVHNQRGEGAEREPLAAAPATFVAPVLVVRAVGRD
ncbi:MAG: hypothetical protein K8J09_22565, partial [Planctomycetes bacterium]|nr:hypothetical protein [Planctomycetota bacterium]